MIIFILFNGFGVSEKEWEYKIEKKNNKYVKVKTDFIKKLKKLGKVYTYTPKIHNIMNYYFTNKDLELTKIYNWFYKKPVPITLDDINIDKECKRIYKLLNNKYKKEKIQFIPVGHSIGSYFALHFSNLYPSKCLKMVFLDPSSITSEASYERIKDRLKKVKSKDISNNNLKFLFDKMMENLKEDRFKFNKKINYYIDKMTYITIVYYYKTMKKELNGKIKVPLISFRNIKFDVENGKNKNKANKLNMNRVKEAEELYKINRNKVKDYYLVNATHFPFNVKRHSDRIIEEIKRSFN